MLIQYQQITRRLLQNDQQFVQFNDYDLRDWINIARGQIAAESESIRRQGSINIPFPNQSMALTDIVFTDTDIVGALTIRNMFYNVGGGGIQLFPRPWPWFSLYYLNNAAPVAGPPLVYSVYRQGASGTFFVNLPDQSYTLTMDCACYPIALIDDSTEEALPYMWTDAVPYYAAYMAYLTVPGDVSNQAANMFDLYQQYVLRARQGATPTVLPHSYEQQRDPTLANKLGSQPFRSATDIGTGAQGGRSRPIR